MGSDQIFSVRIYPNQADYKFYIKQKDLSLAASILSGCVTDDSCCFQADLLALPLSGRQQHQGPGLRPLLPAHTGDAGRQPVLRLLIARTRVGFRRGTAHNSSSSQAALVGLNGLTSVKAVRSSETNNCKHLLFLISRHKNTLFLMSFFKVVILKTSALVDLVTPVVTTATASVVSTTANTP